MAAVGGQRASFLRTSLRFWVQQAIVVGVPVLAGVLIPSGAAVSLITVGAMLVAVIGYLLAAFTPRKQALHDLLAGTVVQRRGGAAAPAQAPPGFAAPAPMPAPAAASGGGGGGCFRFGCLTLTLALLGVVAVVAVLQLRLPERLGLVEPPAARLFTTPPDRLTAEKVLAELKAGGTPTEGVKVYILRIGSTDRLLLSAILDVSKGFRTPPTCAGRDPMLEMMVRLAATQAARERGVSRVAVEFRDESGEQLITITAESEVIGALGAGSLTPEAFMQHAHASLNVANYARAQVLAGMLG